MDLVSFVHDSDAALRMMLRIKMMMIATISTMMAAIRIGLFRPTLTLLSFSTKMLVIKILMMMTIMMVMMMMMILYIRKSCKNRVVDFVCLFVFSPTI